MWMMLHGRMHFKNHITMTKIKAKTFKNSINDLSICNEVVLVEFFFFFVNLFIFLLHY